MATVLDAVTSSLEMLGIIAAGETPSANDSARAIQLLNNLVDAWAIDNLQIFSIERTTHTLTSSLNPHTIGSGGTFSTTRPVEIEKAGIIPNGGTNETPLELWDMQRYAAIPNKTQTGTPAIIYYDPAYTSARGNINLWPIPNAAHTLVLYKPAALHSTLPLASGTTLSVPPGYQRMIEFNLAVEMAPYWGKEASATIVEVARSSKAAVQRLNERTPLLDMDSFLTRPGQYSLLTGRPQ